MKKIIVVDDESTIRTGVCALISKTGKYTVAAACKNGQEALAAIVEHKPDIVFTDIRMPVMDGLTLIERCRELGVQSRFIILSGYGDFEYARAALRLEAHDYILKPINHDSFLQLLDSVALDIDNGKKEQRLHKTQIGLVCLDSCNNSSDFINESAKVAGISLGRFQVIAINPRFHSSPDLHLLDEAAKLIEGILDGEYPSDYIVVPKNSFIIGILSNCDITSQSIPAYLEAVTCQLKERYGVFPVVGIGSRCSDLSDVYVSYTHAVLALGEAIYNNRQKFYFFNPARSVAGPSEAYYSNEIGLFRISANEHSCEKCAQIAKSFFEKAQKQNMPPTAVFGFYSDCVSYMAKISSESQKFPLSSLDTITQRLLQMASLEEISASLKDMIDAYMLQMEEAGCKQYGKAIDDILRYVRTHFSEDLTISSICKEFYINESYFCKLFKSKTGVSFNDYLTELRIRKAQELLKYENLKVYEVSEMVGYSNPKYFAKVFKETTGITPTEFKDKVDV